VRPLPPATPLNPPSPINLPYPIILVPRQVNSYYVPPETFNLLGMFKNPMMLMMVAGGVMLFGLPYLTVRRRVLPKYGSLTARFSRKTLIPNSCRRYSKTRPRSQDCKAPFSQATLRAGVYYLSQRLRRRSSNTPRSMAAIMQQDEEPRPAVSTSTQHNTTKKSTKKRR
jgi:hypothetical protein